MALTHLGGTELEPDLAELQDWGNDGIRQLLVQPLQRLFDVWQVRCHEHRREP